MLHPTRPHPPGAGRHVLSLWWEVQLSWRWRLGQRLSLALAVLMGLWYMLHHVLVGLHVLLGAVLLGAVLWLRLWLGRAGSAPLALDGVSHHQAKLNKHTHI